MSFIGTLAMDYDSKQPIDFANTVLQPKYDGIRCMTLPTRFAQSAVDKRKGVGVETGTCTRSGGYVPNVHARAMLDQLPIGLDGELLAGAFSDTMSALTRRDGEPEFVFKVYDYLPVHRPDILAMPYAQRMQLGSELSLPSYVQITDKWQVADSAELADMLTVLADRGDEGGILRRIDMPHVLGRSSRKLPAVQRIKFWADCEARIVEVIAEQWHDCETNRRDRPELIGTPKDFASSFQCEGLPGTQFEGQRFRAPLSVTDKIAREYLANADKLVGQLAKVRYLSAGVVNKPRLPVCIGVREEFDIDTAAYA